MYKPGVCCAPLRVSFCVSYRFTERRRENQYEECAESHTRTHAPNKGNPMLKHLLLYLVCFTLPFGKAFMLPFAASAGVISSSSDPERGAKAQSDTQEEDSGTMDLPRLPPSDPNDSSIPSLKLGEKFKMDHLGPIIINPDGTTRRIGNWENMTASEREVAWRRISKRRMVKPIPSQ